MDEGDLRTIGNGAVRGAIAAMAMTGMRTFRAGGGAFFAGLPEGARRRPWAGPIYGLLVGSASKPGSRRSSDWPRQRTAA